MEVKSRRIGPRLLHGHQVPVMARVGLVHCGGRHRVGGIRLEETVDLLAVVLVDRVGHEEEPVPRRFEHRGRQIRGDRQDRSQGSGCGDHVTVLVGRDGHETVIDEELARLEAAVLVVGTHLLDRRCGLPLEATEGVAPRVRSVEGERRRLQLAGQRLELGLAPSAEDRARRGRAARPAGGRRCSAPRRRRRCRCTVARALAGTWRTARRRAPRPRPPPRDGHDWPGSVGEGRHLGAGKGHRRVTLRDASLDDQRARERGIEILDRFVEDPPDAHGDGRRLRR